MPRNKKKNRNGGGFQNNHHVNGGGIQKPHHNSNHRNNGFRQGGNNNFKRHGARPNNFFNPNVIRALEDDEILNEVSTNSSSNNKNINNNNDRNNNDRPNNHHRKKENKKISESIRRDKKRMLERLENVGNINNKQKFSIGDTDDSIKKSLIESRPHCKLSCLPDDVFNMIITYVQNYFTCFDSNRDGLLGAYNPKVTFSLSLMMSSSVAHRPFRFDDNIVRESRNLKRIVGNDDHHVEKRFKLLNQGHINTMSLLLKLPPTEHEPKSFKLDNCFFSPHMISFCLAGVFKEGKPSDKVRPLRSFFRVFVCIPDAASQMSIINEQFVITNLTSDQYKSYFYEPPPALANSASSASQPIIYNEPNTSISSVAQNSDLHQKELMIKEFSIKSNLNIEWSKHCLEYSNWNFEDAAKAYAQFKDSIPRDAYLNATT